MPAIRGFLGVSLQKVSIPKGKNEVVRLERIMVYSDLCKKLTFP